MSLLSLLFPLQLLLFLGSSTVSLCGAGGLASSFNDASTSGSLATGEAATTVAGKATEGTKDVGRFRSFGTVGNFVLSTMFSSTYGSFATGRSCGISPGCDGGITAFVCEASVASCSTIFAVDP